ncbi:MAG TPA: hypothetical protein VIN08_01550 [Ohtaekwangia sp.]|uniref:hypothetical protein n=1 Tax=Ohtaekwangia sp. TaxID=2066019 RepID=UPI002F926B11
MICPAYQSAFIYDKNELRKKFSYFQEDSTPKVFTASKNKYLIAEQTSYRKKIRSMQTVPMKPVYVAVPDSLKPDFGMDGEDGVVPGAELDLAARSVIDSIYIEDVPRDTAAAEEDSVYMITKDKEIRVLKYDYPDSLIYDPATGKYVPKTPRYIVTEVTFNVEQDNYMWYLRDYLVLPDVRLAKMGQAAQKAEAAKAAKKGFFGFFKNIFKKKKKEAPADTTTIQTIPEPKEDDFDYVDEDEQQKPVVQEQQQPEKKGLFSFLKKKKKSTDVGTNATTPDEEKPRKKKEKKAKKKKDDPAKEDPANEEKKEDDDGF